MKNSSKFVVILIDGASDHPLKELDGKTPLEVANIPNMDRLAQEGICGWTKNVPQGMHPGSDVAIMSVLGFDPKLYYTGRAPLEAASIGIALGKDDVAYRCNLVRVENNIMVDYSASHISTEEACKVIDQLNRNISYENIEFFCGVSYRHIMVWRNGSDNVKCTPPHDITGKNIKDYLPEGEGADLLLEIMELSRNLLKQHPKTNMIWLWGQGKKPTLPSFYSVYKLNGGVISAVDLIKGIGKLLDMDIINVPGVTGYIDTNYEGKAEYAIEYLEKSGDFVFIHIEAPDEAGHQKDVEAKIKALEDIDSKIVGKILKWSDKVDYNVKILLLPDHPTPIDIGTHTDEEVPYVMWNKRIPSKGESGFNEAAFEGLKKFTIHSGYKLMSIFLGKYFCTGCNP